VRVLRALSLDVVAGAACGGLLAEHMAGARMRPGWWVALLSAVWCVYTGDHLLDASRISKAPATYRRAFHRRHATPLLTVLAIAILAGLAAAWTLRPPVRLFGLGLSLAVMAYLASAQGFILPSLPKEPIAGLLYAAGIWGGPIVTGTERVRMLVVAALLQALAAMLNLVMLGVFESDVDAREGHRSLALRFGRERARLWAGVTGVMGTAISGIMAWLEPPSRDVFVILAVQIVAPALLLSRDRWFGVRERYRLWGDSVFLLGAIPRILA
jgi:4-hydroxybenzoate polyprenyltransferase